MGDVIADGPPSADICVVEKAATVSRKFKSRVLSQKTTPKVDEQRFSRQSSLFLKREVNGGEVALARDKFHQGSFETENPRKRQRDLAPLFSSSDSSSTGNNHVSASTKHTSLADELMAVLDKQERNNFGQDLREKQKEEKSKHCSKQSRKLDGQTLKLMRKHVSPHNPSRSSNDHISTTSKQEIFEDPGARWRNVPESGKRKNYDPFQEKNRKLSFHRMHKAETCAIAVRRQNVDSQSNDGKRDDANVMPSQVGTFHEGRGGNESKDKLQEEKGNSSFYTVCRSSNHGSPDAKQTEYMGYNHTKSDPGWYKFDEHTQCVSHKEYEKKECNKRSKERRIAFPCHTMNKGVKRRLTCGPQYDTTKNSCQKRAAASTFALQDEKDKDVQCVANKEYLEKKNNNIAQNWSCYASFRQGAKDEAKHEATHEAKHGQNSCSMKEKQGKRDAATTMRFKGGRYHHGSGHETPIRESVVHDLLFFSASAAREARLNCRDDPGKMEHVAGGVCQERSSRKRKRAERNLPKLQNEARAFLSGKSASAPSNPLWSQHCVEEKKETLSPFSQVRQERKKACHVVKKHGASTGEGEAKYPYQACENKREDTTKSARKALVLEVGKQAKLYTPPKDLHAEGPVKKVVSENMGASAIAKYSEKEKGLRSEVKTQEILDSQPCVSKPLPQTSKQKSSGNSPGNILRHCPNKDPHLPTGFLRKAAQKETTKEVEANRGRDHEVSAFTSNLEGTSLGIERPLRIITHSEFRELWEKSEKVLRSGKTKNMLPGLPGTERITEERTAWLQNIFELTKLSQKDTFLDICHGTGHAALQAAYTVGCRSIGVEPILSNLTVSQRFRNALAKHFSSKNVEEGGITKNNAQNGGLFENSRVTLLRMRLKASPQLKQGFSIPNVAFFSGKTEALAGPPNLIDQEDLHQFIFWVFTKMPVGSKFISTQPLDCLRQNLASEDSSFFEHERLSVDSYGNTSSCDTTIHLYKKVREAVSNQVGGNVSSQYRNCGGVSLPSDLRENDVLLTAYRDFQAHPGNVRFFSSLKSYSKPYKNAGNSRERHMICDAIVQEVLSRAPQGRFLLFDKKSGTWAEARNREIFEKLSGWMRKRKHHRSINDRGEIASVGTRDLRNCQDTSCDPKAKVRFTESFAKLLGLQQRILQEFLAKCD